MEVIMAIGFLLSAPWHFFTDINVPGLSFTFADLAIGLFLAGLSIKLLNYMLGFTSVSSGSVIHALWVPTRRKDKP